MPALLKKIGTITEKGQVTVPKPIREALGLGYGGRVAFYVDENRQVFIEKESDESDDDPVIDSFLGFLAADMEKHPERVQEFPKALVERMVELTKGMDFNLDDPIVGNVNI